MASNYSQFAEQVISLWRTTYEAEFPLLFSIKEQLQADYPIDTSVGRQGNRGEVSPSTDFAVCVANARSYAIPHLKQLVQVLDHSKSEGIRAALRPDREVLVVDVGCAAGILGLFVDRAGFQRYWGIDTNRWMRELAKAMSGATRNALKSTLDLGLDGLGPYGGIVERKLHRHVDSVDGKARFPEFAFTDGSDSWSDFVISFLSSGCPRRSTVLVVMNHFLFQPEGVPETVKRLLAGCRMISRTGRADVFLISIEPSGLRKPDRYGPQGLRRDLHDLRPPKWMHEFTVTGAGHFLSGKGTKADVLTVAF